MAQVVQHAEGRVDRDESTAGRSRTSRQHVTPWIKWISVAVIIVGIVQIIWLLPIETGVRLLRRWIDELGMWGPIAFGLIYVVAAIFFIPGSALTLVAGAVFGLLWGTVIVSVASTVAAAIAFLIARYLARSAVERKARQYPKFAAVDEAVGREGWKIIALLRLSPAIPYSVGNYLYGLTAVRFWPYVLASWLAMLPGTFMYVYLGHLGRTSLAGADRTSGQWAMLIAGLIATVAVTVYITYIARRAIRSRLAESQQKPSENGDQTMNQPNGTRGAFVAAALAVLIVAATAFSYANKMRLRMLFGPPGVTLKEAYEPKPGGPTFDHSAFDEVVKTHVDADGWVDYEGLRLDPAKLDAYIASLANAPFDKLGRDEKLALLINAYNAFTLRLILDHYPLKSIKDIPANKRWDDQRWKVGKHTWSLNQIEHEQIRPKFKEPRIHFALVCAAVGCPILRTEPYAADRIDEQLEQATRYAHSHDSWFRFESEKNVVHLTSLYKWYGGDFEQTAGSVEQFAARYSPDLKAALDADKKPSIQWIEYDWSLNSAANKDKR